MTYQEIILDVLTGEEIIRKYTPEEIAAVEATIAEKRAELDAKAAEQAAKNAARQAILDKLGLSADEVAALLG